MDSESIKLSKLTYFLNLTSGCTGKGGSGAVGDGDGMGASVAPEPL